MTDEWANKFVTELFGKTRQQAHLDRVCIRCDKPVVPDDLTTDEYGGYVLTALCPDCYNEIKNGSVNRAIAALDDLRGGRDSAGRLHLEEEAQGDGGQPDVQDH